MSRRRVGRDPLDRGEPGRHERFAVSLGDIVPLEADQMIDPAHFSREAILAPPSFDANVHEMADWVEVELHRQQNEETAAHEVENWLSDPDNWLSVEERDALLAAFDGRGSKRWEPLTHLLRRQVPSLALSRLLAELIDAGGFFAGARLSSSHTAEGNSRKVRTDFRRGVRDLIAAQFPDRSENAVQRKATAVATVLLGLEKTTTLTADVRKERDVDQTPLAALRQRIEDWPCR